ncbi:MAG: hydroxymethylbilane synthase [Anaerolineae bacterium]|nr:hydroxymethylbilane synthase [Phycisphaerae bacterium]
MISPVLTDRPVLRLGTRGSVLAQAQSQLIASQLMSLHPKLRVELVIVKTTGDRVMHRPLYDIGGKGLFTKEIEIALLSGEIDFAVHSYKDMPVTMPLVEAAVGKLVVAAVPRREDGRDVAVMRDPRRGPYFAGARIGTSSLRRRCQILERNPGVRIESLRGNIDTRIRQVRAGDFDTAILALAGLKRIGAFDESFMQVLSTDELLPAAGQGALALQCRRDDEPTRSLLSALDDPITANCVAAEREVVRALDGDCHSPIAAFATFENGEVVLRVAVGQRGGDPPVRRARTSVNQADFAPESLAAAAVTALQPSV